MRIVCPECGANYDIPDTAIPAPGRSVQCAICTNAWYQLSGGTSAPVEATARPPARAPERATEAEPDTESRPGGNTPPPRREVDAEVLRILREEAAYETARRERDGSATGGAALPDKAPAASLAQASPGTRPTGAKAAAPDPPATEPPGVPPEGPPAGPALRDSRLARLKAAEDAAGPRGPAPDTEGSVEAPKRRGDAPPLLAQADMAATLTRAKAPEQATRNLPARISPADRTLALQARRRRGFRLGFAGTAGVICAALIVYLAAPQVAARLPQGMPFAETVVSHGDRVQAAIVTFVRSQTGL